MQAVYYDNVVAAEVGVVSVAVVAENDADVCCWEQQ